MELGFLSYEEMKERVDSFGAHLKEQICGLGFEFHKEYGYCGERQDEYIKGMDFKFDGDKTILVIYGIMRYGNEIKEIINFNYVFWSVLDKQVLGSLSF